MISSFSDKRIPIVFSADQGYVPYLAVALQSLAEHVSEDWSYDILIMDGGIKDDSKSRLREIVENKPQCRLRYLDISEQRKELDRLFVDRHLSSATYYRLILPGLLPEYEKILYLDCDLLVMGDPADVFQYDIEGYLVAGVKEIATFWIDPTWHQTWYLSMKYQGVEDPLNSFNAGVLLMNLKAFRNERIELRLLALAGDNSFEQHDQDVLNIACEDRWLALPGEWNYQYHQCEPYEFPESVACREQAVMAEPPVYRIVHYIRDQKPWSHPEKPLAPLWWDYARRNGFYRELRSSAPGIFSLVLKMVKHCVACVLYECAAFVAPSTVKVRLMRRVQRLRAASCSLRTVLKGWR